MVWGVDDVNRRDESRTAKLYKNKYKKELRAKRFATITLTELMTSRVLDKLKRADWRAEFFRILDDWHRFLIHTIFSGWYRWKCRLLGVDIGNNVSFNGKMHFSRFKCSSISIGDKCVFNSSFAFNQLIDNKCFLHTSCPEAKIVIGNNSGFSGVKFICYKLIHVGNHVTVGANTVFIDSDVHEDLTGKEAESIIVEDNVFIGRNCSIMKGVHIGKNVIIGACSVVTHDIPANTVAAGIPCKVLREL